MIIRQRHGRRNCFFGPDAGGIGNNRIGGAIENPRPGCRQRQHIRTVRRRHRAQIKGIVRIGTAQHSARQRNIRSVSRQREVGDIHAGHALRECHIHRSGMGVPGRGHQGKRGNRRIGIHCPATDRIGSQRVRGSVRNARACGRQRQHICAVRCRHRAQIKCVVRAGAAQHAACQWHVATVTRQREVGDIHAGHALRECQVHCSRRGVAGRRHGRKRAGGNNRLLGPAACRIRDQSVEGNIDDARTGRRQRQHICSVRCRHRAQVKSVICSGSGQHSTSQSHVRSIPGKREICDIDACHALRECDVHRTGMSVPRGSHRLERAGRRRRVSRRVDQQESC